MKKCPICGQPAHRLVWVVFTTGYSIKAQSCEKCVKRDDVKLLK